MMAVVTKVTKVPIQAKFLPIIFPNDPITPNRVFLPMDISMMRRGIDQRKRKRIQGMRNTPPPCWEMMRGKRHIFPVPIAIPRPAKIIPHREENNSFFLIAPNLLSHILSVNDQERMKAIFFRRFFC